MWQEVEIEGGIGQINAFCEADAMERVCQQRKGHVADAPDQLWGTAASIVTPYSSLQERFHGETGIKKHIRSDL